MRPAPNTIQRGGGGGRSGGLKGHGDRTGQEASRAAPILGAMAERGGREAMADPGTQEAMAGQGTQELPLPESAQDVSILLGPWWLHFSSMKESEGVTC